MSRASELLSGIARRAALPAAAGGGTGAWIAFAHDGVTAVITAAFVVGITAGLPKAVKAIYRHLPDIVREKGEAKAKVVDAEARRTQAEVARINALSEARNSAKRADAEVRNSARRADVEARLLLGAMKTGRVDDAIALLRLQKPRVPKKENHTEPPEDGAATVHPIRR